MCTPKARCFMPRSIRVAATRPTTSNTAPANCSANPCTSVPIPDADIGSGQHRSERQRPAGRPLPGTTYHWRVVATNVTETTDGPDRTFTTFPFISTRTNTAPTPTCASRPARPLCSTVAPTSWSPPPTAAAMTSSPIWSPGQTPFGGYPEAESPRAVLYGVHDGGIPGIDHPTNSGVDPYVATRGQKRLEHRIRRHSRQRDPASASLLLDPSAKPTPVSTPSLLAAQEAARPALKTASHRHPDPPAKRQPGAGHGGLARPRPSAEADGYIAKDLSPNGEHFVFGSTSQFEPDGNSNGDVSIYDRNLSTGETHVVSKTPAAPTCPA